MANIKGLLGAAGVASIAALSMSTAALADEEKREFGYSVTLTATSDYLFRGVSLTENRPAFQPFVEFTYGQFYLDFWGSNIHAGDYKPWEVDLYAGWRPTTGPISWDLGVLWYTYPDSPNAWNLDYVEFKVAATVSPVDKLSLTVTGYATPDQGVAYPETETIEGLVSYELPQFHIFTPTISGGVGYTHSETSSAFPGGAFLSGQDYTYWNAGLKLTVDKFFIDLRYWDTDISKADDPDKLATARFLGSFGVNLP